MRDTKPDLDRRHRELIMARSGVERLAMGCAMFDDAKAIAEAGLRAERPGLSEAELRRLLLMRLYDKDLPFGWLAKAGEALERSWKGNHR